MGFFDVKMGSFNICKLSLNNLSTKKNIHMLKTIIEREKYDIIALQEVIDEKSVCLLAQTLIGNWGWSYDRPPRMNYRNSELARKAAEGYAFLWNKDVIDLVRVEIFDKDGNSYNPPRYREYKPRIINSASNEILIDRKLKLIRNPYYGRFAPRSSTNGVSKYFEIRIINTHIIDSVNSSTKQYLTELNTTISDAKLRRKEFFALSKSILPLVDNRLYGNKENSLQHYTFLMGDYNLNLDRPTYDQPKLKRQGEEEITINGAKKRKIITVQDQKTTVKQKVMQGDKDYYANNFDHFTYDKMTVNNSTRVKPEYTDIVGKYYGDKTSPCESFIKEVSDHIPIGLHFSYVGRLVNNE